METKELDSVHRFKDITEKMAKTYERKNHDYGSSFDETCEEFGLVAPAIRMNDKLKRFKKLIKEDALVKEESIRDTLLDLANYSILTIMWMDRKCESELNRQSFKSANYEDYQ